MNWDKFINETQKDYYRMARNIVYHKWQAEDVVQQSYIDLHTVRNRYKTEDMKKIGNATVRNKSLTTKKRWQEKEHQRYRLDLVDIMSHDYIQPDDSGQFIEELLKFVPEDKDMLLLSAYGYSLKEIATKKNISHSYARKRVAKARRRLRQVAKMI